MLIASLLPFLSRYSLGFDLVAGPDDLVTLTILPRKIEGAAHNPDAQETRPISITATAAEIDAELGLGTDGALGQLIASRKALGQQIAEQREAAEAARKASTEAAKVKSAAATSKSLTPAQPAKGASPTSPPAGATPGEPASLW